LLRATYTDVQSDRNNCGACCNACAADQTCLRGACVNCDVCRSGCQFIRVQAAVDAATTGATISLCPGFYREHVRINKNLTLVGQGRQRTEVEIDGQGQLLPRAVITVEKGGTVTLRNLTVTGGNSNGNQDVDVGGGIGNFGNLTLEQVDVADNEATNFIGGGIANLDAAATPTLDATRVHNSIARDGGGIGNTPGQVTLPNRTEINNNTA
jgi:hypothetical protein